MTGLLRQRTFLRRRELKPSYDVVIIGGGVNGLSLAHNLAAHHGITDVAVLESNYIGSGGSGRNTQVVRANYNTPETVPLYKASLEIWRTLSAELDFNLLFSTQGELDLCHTHDSLEVERDKSLLNRAYGVQTDVLMPDEIARMNDRIRNALQAAQSPDVPEAILNWARDVMDPQIDHLMRFVDDLLDASDIVYRKLT